VALKMLTAHWIDVPITLSLAIMGAILALCAVISVLAPGKTAAS
jgi:tellurite resistance protein TerC